MSLDGLPARSIRIICSHCKGEAFRLIGPPPPGAVHGQFLPSTGNYGVHTIECLACGETYVTKLVQEKS